jgi:DNA-binding transcriptional MerR regulator
MTTSTGSPPGAGPRLGDGELMTAGRFGLATMLSAKALRLYADRGLLPPRFVDPANGYRYYASDQIRTGWLIALLRSADLSLDEIAGIVDAEAADAPALLEQAAQAVRQRAEVNQAVLARARLQLRGDPVTEMATRVEPDRPVLSVQRRMRPDEMDQAITDQVDRLRTLAADAGLDVTGDPFGVFHGPVTNESDGPLEIALPVDGLTEVTDADVRSYRLTGGPVAERFAEGAETDFPEILALYDEVHAWITASGRTPVGPPREIWHNGPRDPEPLRLTISWPYASA